MNRMKEVITDIVFTEGAVIVIFSLSPIEVDYLIRVTQVTYSADQQRGHVHRVIFVHDGLGNLNCSWCCYVSLSKQVSEI